MEPDSPEILETLHTLIAPGNQVRLSPYVEAMQFQLLFGRTPDPNKRFESAKAILDANRTQVQRIAETWSQFDQAGKDFRPECYDGNFLDAYLVYYLTVNVGKLQILFLELLRQRLLPPRLHLLDVGVASGTTFVAFLDFLAAWESACWLHDVAFPIKSIEMTGVDVQQDCLDYSRKAIHTLARVIDDSRVSGQPFTTWADTVRLIKRNVALEPLDEPGNPTLLVCSNILNEIHGYDAMSGRRHSHIEQLIRQLPEQSLVLLLEPGDQCRATALNGWRSRLLDEDPTLHMVGPCGAEQGTSIPVQCGSCWNARRESMHRPLLYQRFCEDAARVGQRGSPKWQEEYENNLLSWSYLCLVRSRTIEQQYSPPLGQTSFMARYVGRYRPKGDKNGIELLIPESNHGITTSAAAKPSQVLEYLKVCPASVTDINATSFDQVLLRRVAGFTTPSLRHGQLVIVERDGHYQDAQKDRSLVIMPASITPLEQMRSDDGFLSDYTANSRQGINAIAQRLFGFPAMREFQHQILERVLTGRSIFAIAATGGGKSECFILPAMLLSGLTVVISPLKSLMQDQYDQRLCARYGLGSLSTFINSSIPFRERENRIRRMELGYYKLVYLTPEQSTQVRMLDSLRRAHERVGLRYLALDEAHCISHWGHDFRPAYLNLLTRFQGQGLDPVRIALTATASPQVRKDICDELSLDPRPLEQGGDLLVYSANRPELNLIVKVTDTVSQKVADIEYRLRQLLRGNRNNADPGAAIVFMPHTGSAEARATDYKGQELDFSGRRTVAHFASHLERALGLRVGIYHGKMEDDSAELSQDEPEPEYQSRTGTAPGVLGEIHDRTRRSEQEHFIQGDTAIMVATKGFGMGIDKPNIRLVLHHTTPGNLEAYTQEAGRAGRDGALADVILYFTPQAPDDATGQATADGEVQRFFLDQKYIREIDVRVIWDFLTIRARQPNAFHSPGKLYFTADEVMGHFDALELKGAYQWPGFPKRQAKGKESLAHAAILDHGHLYQEKINLIDRILSVCYRIRPVLGGRKLALLDELVSVGSSLKGGRIANSMAILASNDRFANILREQGLDARALSQHLDGDKDLFPFAARLCLSLEDTASLLQDIRKADGEWRGQAGQRKWKSYLLDFLVIAAPKRGPAEGQESLQQWRSYAGASRRATKKGAEQRARAAGRDRPTDDDWFDWKELPYTKGWEIAPGRLLNEPGWFNAYLKAFLAIHERRRDEDNRAYQLLLQDYVGVTEEGARLDQNGGCLRVVMLGYLKTNETVIDGNCGGCSVCCPDERFQTDLMWRKARIISLSEDLSQLLAEFEQRVTESPPSDRLDRFWEQVTADEQAGRAVIGYLRGWTNRLISETPGHVTAYWLRADGMLRERFPMVAGDLLNDLDRLRELVPNPGDLTRLADMLSLASVHVGAYPARFDLAQARLMQRLGRTEQELNSWISLLDRGPGVEMALEANLGLAALFAPGAAFADTYELHKALGAAVDIAPKRVRETMEPYLPEWSFAELVRFLQDVEQAVVVQIATDWFATHDRQDSRALLQDALSVLNQDGYSHAGAIISQAVQPRLLDALEELPNDADDLDVLLCRVEPYITCHIPRWLVLAAERFGSLGRYAAAKEYWECLMAIPAGAGPDERGPDMTLKSSCRLATMFAEDGPYPDAQQHQEMLISAIGQAPDRAAQIMEPYIAQWSLRTLWNLLLRTSDDSHVPVIGAWFHSASIELGALTTEIRSILEGLSDSQARFSIARRFVCQLFLALADRAHGMLSRDSCVDLAALRSLGETWLTEECRGSFGAGTHVVGIALRHLLKNIDFADATIVGRVIEPVNGGFRVDLGGVVGFLPMSQSQRLRFTPGLPEQFLEFKIIEFQYGPRSNVVVSRLKFAEYRFSTLEVGQYLDGRVADIVDYGAFVDLGGFTGLLHKNEMGKTRDADRSAILVEGQRIRVVVLDIDRARHRVSLRLSWDSHEVRS
jgi:superfamily II DNA helicase RecQ